MLPIQNWNNSSSKWSCLNKRRVWGGEEIGSTMRDTGLEQAIRAAGGVASLARGIGIAQPSVSAWSRIPAERVLAVEALTQVPRNLLRPDLYGSSGNQVTTKPEIDEIDQLRAAEYGLLSLLLGKAPDTDTLARVARLKGDASDLGMAHVELAMAASAADDRGVSKEFFNLFVGVGRGDLLPYASYYLTGFLHERPLARLRSDLFLLGVERVENNPDPEDHMAFLCEVMAGIIAKRFSAEAGTDRDFFEKHIKPWASRFFTDLEEAEAAEFYRAVGKLGRVFIEIETEAFALPS
jgi:TorA maturation chaperone TorD